VFPFGIVAFSEFVGGCCVIRFARCFKFLSERMRLATSVDEVLQYVKLYRVTWSLGQLVRHKKGFEAL
jgi:hypothetical protein